MFSDRVHETGDPLLDQATLHRFLRVHHLPPLHRFGQHFLVDRDVLQDIVAASQTDPAIPVIEVGAGLGGLTRALAREREWRKEKGEWNMAPLIAVELDRRLIPLLTEQTREFPSVIVTQADVLKVDVQKLLTMAQAPRRGPRPTGLFGPGPMPYDVVGSIPYNITAPTLKKFLTGSPGLRRMTLLVDEAVADAIAAEPPAMSLRAVGVQVYAKPAVVRRRIPPSSFVPPPAVHSAILVLVTRKAPLVPAERERAFFRLVRAGFSQKRKMLSNALSATYRLSPAEAAQRLRRARLAPSRRAQTLSIAEWKRLLGVFGTSS